ncbi:hypothetical protein UFOVP1665_4 [uncultured Caudovirales phage]|uniref:Uncharacterized protein n=1 Tax=uncultured Caudovirales phage TaxID=2100421 RepID=A0A6J5T5R5_9CAUD|nr:hypothetical protein UFOVP1665_4 [uncultured Caudovirales phage]
MGIRVKHGHSGKVIGITRWLLRAHVPMVGQDNGHALDREYFNAMDGRVSTVATMIQAR